MDFKELVKSYANYDESFYEDIKTYNSLQVNDGNKLVCPLFLDEPSGYKDTKLKIMIFGQEVNKWNLSEEDKLFYGDFENGIEDFLDLYTGNRKVFYENKFKNSTPFNAELLRIENFLNETHPNIKVGLLWNNLIKLTALDMNTGIKLYNKVPAVKAASTLIKSELECYRPNIIIFYTGPNYDFVLNDSDIFDIKNRHPIDGFSEKELLSIDIPGVSLALRTYHPGYLVRNNELFNRIKQSINSLIIQAINQL